MYFLSVPGARGEAGEKESYTESVERGGIFVSVDPTSRRVARAVAPLTPLTPRVTPAGAECVFLQSSDKRIRCMCVLASVWSRLCLHLLVSLGGERGLPLEARTMNITGEGEREGAAHEVHYGGRGTFAQWMETASDTDRSNTHCASIEHRTLGPFP